MPATALVRSTEGTYVWAVRADQLARVRVEEAMREGDHVAVRGALEPGERVVRRGAEDLIGGAWPPM